MQHHIIKTREDFLNLKSYVAQQNYRRVFLDTETDNKEEHLANLFGVGIGFTEDESFYFPIRNKDKSKYWSEKDEKEIARWINFISSTHRVIGHNLLYDTIVLFKNWGFDLTEFIYSDTILQKHILDEDRPHALKETAKKYLGEWADKAQQALYDNIKLNGGSVTKDNLEMWKADTDVLAEYCCWDVMLTAGLFFLFEPRIFEEKLDELFYTETMPLYRSVTIPMKMKGFPVDVEYFKDLNFTISKEIDKLQEQIQEAIEPFIQVYIEDSLNKKYPVKRGGLFPKYYAKEINFDLPKNKEGNITLSKKELLKLVPKTIEHKDFLDWLNGDDLALDLVTILNTQINLFKEKEEQQHLFNLNSNNDLKYLFFTELNETPLNYTKETEEPQVDDEFLDSIKDRYDWVQLLIDYKKLMKLKSTYIEGVLERQIDGIIYTSMLQFGTTSGRYSSTSPNLQNLPATQGDDSNLSELVKKYVNSIRKGFIASKDCVLIDADYSQLEPRAFAEASGDYLLQQSFINGEDLYGSIAKNIWNLECSANEVGVLYPKLRKTAKVVALAVVYGAEAGRISKLLKISYEEAQQIINDYLEAYPGLKKYMSDCDIEACTKGQVSTKFGRIRHIPFAKEAYDKFKFKLLNRPWAKKHGLEELSWKFKSALNLAKNHKIQGVAAHIVNRSLIAIAKDFKEQRIRGYIALMIHDQIIGITHKDDAEKAKNIFRNRMENTVKISVPLIAEPKIALNLKDSH